jgi:hypothetical protein
LVEKLGLRSSKGLVEMQAWAEKLKGFGWDASLGWESSNWSWQTQKSSASTSAGGSMKLWQ